jgi:sirohydrochlorin ferrochelatase
LRFHGFSFVTLRHVYGEVVSLYPLLLGGGKHVFAEGTVPAALRLTESVTHASRILHLAYEPVGVSTYDNVGDN